MQSKLSDIELIDLTLAGDQSAYADLVKRHQRFVFTLALRFTKTREDAEEIAQDCFIKAYRSLDAFQRQSKFSTWLYSIVYTTAMTALRKKRVETASIDDENTFIQVESQNSSYNGEQSLEEIGQTMGIDPNTVKVKLFRARQRLKEKLERKFKT
jgi:DNA-directed RNA polymerase specialized sigma24 family protein